MDELLNAIARVNAPAIPEADGETNFETYVQKVLAVKRGVPLADIQKLDQEITALTDHELRLVAEAQKPNAAVAVPQKQPGKLSQLLNHFTRGLKVNRQATADDGRELN